MNAIKEFLADALAVAKIKPKEVALFAVIGFLIGFVL